MDKMTRIEANRKIVAAVAEEVEKHPELRFHQLLQNMGIETPNADHFFDESTMTLKSILPLNNR